MEYGMSGKNQLGVAPVATSGFIQMQDVATTERTSQIQSASISLEAKIEDVLNRVQAIEKRLYPILRPCPPMGGESQKQAVAPVPLAETLQIFGARLDSCSAQLGSILERIEL